jgi:signal transduction histidine kinase/ligand-binding sensor domain-containing protein
LLNGRLIPYILLVAAVAFGAPVSRQTWDTESGLPQNTVQAILQTRDGYLWFATEGGLARFDSERFTVFNTRNTPALRSNDTRALLEDPSGTLWIATAAGVAAVRKGTFRAFTTAEGLPSNGVTGFFQDGRHRACAITADGTACFDQGHFVPLTSARVPHVPAVDRAMQELVSSSILCSYKDREGNVWIGTESSGVTIVRKLHFEAFSDHADGLDGQVRCVYRERSGAIWYGTDSQGLTRYSDGKFQRFTDANGLSSNVIVSLGEDLAGDLLIGTPDGLNRLHQGVITLVTSSEGLPDDLIRSIHTDPDGTLWIGTRRGLARFRDNKFQTFSHADGLGSDLIGSITRDGSGHLWVATLNGLSRLDGGHFTNFTTANGLSSNVITALYAGSDGSLWIGTQGGGLDRLTGGSFKHVTTPSGIPEVIYGITEDASHDLWLASDSGVFRVTNNGREVVAYGVSDGMRVYECSGGGHPGIATSPDGSIWFATLKGAALLRPDVPFNRVAPPVVVESVTIDNRTVGPELPIEVAPGASRLAFSYAALSFAAPQKVQFRYRLENFDKGWIDAGNSRTAFYTNLSPGSYSFRVIARNGDGTWNREGAVVMVNIEPHFYQTWWFGAVVLVLLIVAAYSTYRWRLVRVQAQVESRFEAVLQERNRIAREIHDTLAQGFAGVSVQLEIVSRKLGLSEASVREHLDQARMLVRSSLAEARRSIWELRSQSAEIEDLASRLSKMAAQMSGPGQPRIAVQVRGTFRPLPPRTEDELLRIAQEAVTNAIRHAQASEINIELAFDPKLLRMTVADDGRGFSPDGQTSGVSGHFGLKGMRERASWMDAKLDLETAPGAGTKLSVEVAV